MVPGYPDQALTRSQEALARAQELEHPFNLAYALCIAGVFSNVLRRELSAARDHVEPLIRLSAEEGFSLYQAWGTFLRGWFLAEEGQAEEGMAQMRQGLTASRATGTEKDEKARQILAEIYGWFSKGFDTPGLKEAKALLEELS